MRALKIAFLASCSFALVMIGTPASVSTELAGVSSAYAKNGNGNGGGNGNGNAGGNSGNAGGNSSASRSTDAGGKSLSSPVGKVTGSKATAKKSVASKSAKTSPKNIAKADTGKAKAKVEKVAAVREKNFHAKLAGLNSLKRNVNAYLNAQDPRMQAIRAFALASIALEDAKAAAAEAEDKLAAAETALTGVVGAIDSYDGTFDYSTAEPETLADRLTDLQEIDPLGLPENQAAALETEISALSAALKGPEGIAYDTAASEAQGAAEDVAELEGQADDDALKAALEAAANKNRLAEYGEDYVDQEMLDWAKGVLGVGEEFGKIDEMRTALEAAEATDSDDPTEEETASQL